MPLTELKKWSATIYKPKTGIDAAQIPAVGASVTVYRQGATVSTGPVIIDADGGENTVSVYDIGRMSLFQQVSVGTSSSTMLVTAIYSAISIGLTNNNAQAITVAAGDRLVIRALTDDGDFLGIKLYQDVTGATVWNRGVPGFTINNANGFVEFYTTERFFDYIVSGTGLTTTLYRDEESGNKSPAWVNVKDYPTFQAAIDAMVLSGTKTLYIPAGHYTSTTVPAVNLEGLTITSSFKIIGDGAGVSWVQHDNGNTDFLTITGPLSFAVISDVLFYGGQNGTGRGVVMDACSEVNFVNMRIEEFPSWGLYIHGTSGDSVNNTFNLTRVAASHTNGAMYVGPSVFANKFVDCEFLNGDRSGVVAVRLFQTDGIRFYGCTFEHVQDASFLAISGACEQLTVDNCWFEHNGVNGVATPSTWMIDWESPATGVLFEHNHFVRTGADVTSIRILKVHGAGGLWETTFFCNNGVTQSLPVGTDDFVFVVGDQVLFSGSGHVIFPTTGARTPFTITHPNPDGGLTRQEISRSKLRGLGASEIAALPFKNAGDMILDANGLGYRLQFHYGGLFRTLNILLLTDANRNTYTWAPGDMVWRTDAPGPRLELCTVGGLPGTWVAV